MSKATEDDAAAVTAAVMEGEYALALTAANLPATFSMRRAAEAGFKLAANSPLLSRAPQLRDALRQMVDATRDLPLGKLGRKTLSPLEAAEKAARAALDGL